MITTTTSIIPNTEITEILSVVHNRVVLGTNLFSDISASFSDFFGGNNSAYEKRLSEITDEVIEGLTKKALKLKADALIDLKIDVDEISGGSKSMFMVTAIATAVLLKSDITNNNKLRNSEIISFKEINISILKSRVIKMAKEGNFNLNVQWVADFVSNNELIEIFESYINYLRRISNKLDTPTVPENWKIHFDEYISQFESVDLFDNTLKYFSKDSRSDMDFEILKVIFKRLVVDYNKIFNIFNIDGSIYEKQLCLNILLLHNETYTKVDFTNIKLIVEKLKLIYPNLSIEEEGNGIFTKGLKYWRCKCGTKNEIVYIKHCTNCHLDKYGNLSFVSDVGDVINNLEDILIFIK
jgi:uncharacterized protein YbjQ (UPF0145 family)